MESNKDKFMKDNKHIDKPSFVCRDSMTANKDYIEWLSDVKNRFRNSQIKATIRVNAMMLEFYWSIGRDLVALQAEERWGTGVVKQFALDMRQAFPDVNGFSLSNIKYMKQWYLFYFEGFTKSQQVVGQLEMPEVLGQIPWGHHIQIVSKCKSFNEAFFYINKIVTERWSRSFLEHQLASNLYEIQGSAITNFDATLPTSQSKLVKELLKQEYDLSFITVEEVKKEKDLENALANNITRFLLELGRGFSYVGRQISCKK